VTFRQGSDQHSNKRQGNKRPEGIRNSLSPSKDSNKARVKCKQAKLKTPQKQSITYPTGYQEFVRQYSVVVELVDADALSKGLCLGGELVGVVVVKDEGERDAGGSTDQREDGDGHVKVVDAPGAVAGRVQLAAEEDAICEAREDEEGAHAGRRDVEDDVGGQCHASSSRG